MHDDQNLRLFTEHKMKQGVIAKLVQLFDAANELEAAAHDIMTASDFVHSQTQNLGPDRYNSEAAETFRMDYSGSRERLNAVGSSMLTIANDLRDTIERIADAAKVSSAYHDLKYWSEREHLNAMQAEFANMDRDELLKYLEREHLQFCGVYRDLSDQQLRETLFYMEIMNSNGVSRFERSSAFSGLLNGDIDLNAMRKAAIASFRFDIDLPEQVSYQMVEASRTDMASAEIDAAREREIYELAKQAQEAKLRQDYIDWKTGHSSFALDRVRSDVYFKSTFGGSVDDLAQNSFWAEVEYEKTTQVHDLTVDGFRSSVANWAEQHNYNNGLPYGVDEFNNWNEGRHCTTYVTTAIRENGFPIDVIHGNSQLHTWMQDHQDRWEYTSDLDSLEAGDFVFMNWHGKGMISQTLASGNGISHVVLVTGANEYAQWNPEILNKPLSQIPGNTDDYIGVRMLY